MNDRIRILGIDPGLETTGVSVLDVKKGKYFPVYSGCVITKKKMGISERLEKIFTEINNLIKKYCPDCLAVEKLFFNVNTKTALDVGQARGVSVLAGSVNNIKLYEYTPLEVKQAVVGYGRATKKQVKYMLKTILGVKNDFFPRKDDAWDAMAISVCHANNRKFRDKVKVIRE
ncbi:MAG: crossover junction endodeoxyribonuclease RuvC [Actinomycetota bacterium]|nr:crossover junction endodeoxyribonuclease RuvC [Actinomycetota bacterium]